MEGLYPDSGSRQHQSGCRTAQSDYLHSPDELVMPVSGFKHHSLTLLWSQAVCTAVGQSNDALLQHQLIYLLIDQQLSRFTSFAAL
jgi:hypothetical protein